MTSAISRQSFLTDFIAIDVDDVGAPTTSGIRSVDAAVCESLETGLPAINRSENFDEDAVAMSIPIYRGENIVSIAVVLGSATPECVGVMEVWQPVGDFEELSLTQGFFGPLERFQNVSSFVRFEKGSGLPGQVWRHLSYVIHDNLSSHAGFLRAAGASAESLQVAFGIPVHSKNFLATALLISSDASPIARGYEVWRCAEDHFLLESKAYQRMEQSLTLDDKAELPMDSNLPALALHSGVASISEDPEVVYSGRPFRNSGDCKGVAIPFYEGDRITNILTLLL